MGVVFTILLLTGCLQKNELPTKQPTPIQTPVIQKIESLKTLDTPTEYVNKAFGYKFKIPVGTTVNTNEMVTYEVTSPEKAIELGLNLGDKKIASLIAMSNLETFPELKNRANLSAKDYVQEWWNDNKNDHNPNVSIELSPVFSSKINGNEWFGFMVKNLLVFANNTGGTILEVPTTIMITKKGDTFYRWQFNTDAKDYLETVLNTFEIQ